MATILDTLRAINPYPLTATSFEAVATARGLDLAATALQDILRSAAFRLAKADVYMLLADAPDISQGGISYSFTDEQREAFRALANDIYAEVGDEEDKPSTRFGYKGSNL